MSHSAYGHFKDRPVEGVWHSLNRIVMTLCAFMVIALLICAFLPVLKDQRESNRKLDELRAEISRQSALLARREREVDLLKNNPEYLELIARDRLDLMKPGETIYRLDPLKPDSSTFRLRP
jgi:cell division protein FtsB